MMSGNSATIKIVAILIAGIVVGSGVGYFYASSVYDPQITSYKGQVSTLTGQVTTLTSENTAKASEITGLNTEITGLESTVTQKNAAITTLEGTVAGYKTQVTGLQADISDYKEQVTTLQSQYSTSNGYLRVAIYDMSMQFPDSMSIGMTGATTGTSATEDSGYMYGVSYNGDYLDEYMELGYSTSTTAPDLDAKIAERKATLSEYTQVSDGIKDTTINGHAARYEYVTITDGGVTTYFVYASWYCDETDTVFVFYRFASTATSITSFEHFADNFYCHIE